MSGKNTRSILAPPSVNRGSVWEITPDRVKIYSICPNLSKYSWNNDKPMMNTEAEVLAWTIRKIYSYSLIYGELPRWRYIPKWIDMGLARYIQYEENPQALYRKSKSLLVKLHRWFFDYCIPNPNECLVNLPVAVQVDNSTFYSDTIDIISVGNTIKLFDFKQISHSSQNIVNDIYSDIEVMTRIWGLKKATGEQAAEYSRIYILPKSIQVRTIAITDKYREKLNKIINFLLKGLSSATFYPSISDHCNRCRYVDECKL